MMFEKLSDLPKTAQLAPNSHSFPPFLPSPFCFLSVLYMNCLIIECEPRNVLGSEGQK